MTTSGTVRLANDYNKGGHKHTCNARKNNADTFGQKEQFAVSDLP